MRCPGQDRAYWKDDVVSESPCPKCGTAVEFFKDESSGRCTNCGHRFKNPNVSFDCAKWCAFAEECLGFTPERTAPADPGQGALAGRLIREIKDHFQTEQARIADALTVFQYARELLAKEGGDPRIVLAAALLLEIGVERPGAADASVQMPIGQADGLVKVKQIMEGIGLDADTIECVCHLIGSYRAGRQFDSIELRIVADAHELAKLSAEAPSVDKKSGDLDELQKTISGRLRTKTGKARAEAVLEVFPREISD